MKRSRDRRYPTRALRDADRRRERAHVHLASVRARSNRATGPPIWQRMGLSKGFGRLLAAAVASLSVAAGAALGTPFGASVTSWLAPANLSQIHVRGAFRLDADLISAATGAALGAPISRQDIPQITERVARHPWVSSARAAVLPGGILIVAIEEQVPEAVVVIEVDRGATRLLLVDRHGMPFAPASADDVEVLPHLLPTGRIAEDAPDTRLAAALDLAKRLPEHGLPGTVEIFIAPADDPEGLALHIPAIPGRIVLGWVDLDARLEQLAALLSADLAEVRDASRIDLRFGDQAVLRTHSKVGEQAAAARGFAVPSIELSTG